MSDNGSGEHKWTYLGLAADSGHGPWRYQVFPSVKALREKLHLFANVETDPTARVTSVAFQPCLNDAYRSQDRRVVQSWNMRNGRWTFVGVFDGHAGHETADYAVTELPLRIKSNLELLLEGTGNKSMNSSPETVSSLLADTIIDFDKSLLEDVSSLFSGGLEGALTLSDAEIKEILNDADRGGQNLTKLRRCKRGSTALLSIVDPSGENLWVANLGDCEAVLGTKLPNGTWRATPLTSNHNGGNEVEVKRLRDEHPGEDKCISRGRVLGAIAVTRALGDYMFKVPVAITTSILLKAEPRFVGGNKLAGWLSRNITPPYLANTPDVFHYDLTGRVRYEENDATAPNMFLIMCSDGLTAVYPNESNDITHWVQTVGLAMDRGDSSPPFELLWEALGGEADTVAQYMTLESTEPWLDDITIAVLTL